MREILEGGREEEKQVQWNEVARRLFERSGETSFRTAKHCRERWLNELDPAKNRYPSSHSGTHGRCRRTRYCWTAWRRWARSGQNWRSF